MLKPKCHKVCKPRYNWGNQRPSFQINLFCAHVLLSPERPQRRKECGATKQFEQSQLKHGKKNKIWISDLRSNKLFKVMWQPKAAAWKQSWKYPGSISVYKRVKKHPPVGQPSSHLLQSQQVLYPGIRSWLKLLNEMSNVSKQFEVQNSQCCYYKSTTLTQSRH